MFTGCETEKQRSNRRISNANAPGTRAQQTRQKNKDYEKYKTNETKYNPEADYHGIGKQETQQDFPSSYRNPRAVPSVMMGHF